MKGTLYILDLFCILQKELEYCAKTDELIQNL